MQKRQIAWLFGQTEDLLQQGLEEGTMPETWNITARHILRAIREEKERLEKK